MIKFKVPLFILCGIVSLSTTPAFAGLINGSQLNVSGDALVSASSITWQCNQPADLGCPSAGHGDFTVTNSTGSFAQYNSTPGGYPTGFGLIANINNGPQPLNAAFSLPGFMTFALNNDITIELTFIPLGNDPLSTTCAGLQHCTPTNPGLITGANPGGVSAFNLDQQSTNTAATFSVVGIVHQLSSGESASINGIFTSQFANMTPQQVLAALGQSTSTYSSNLSLTISTTQTPEPATVFATGFGLVLIGLLGRRRFKS